MTSIHQWNRSRPFELFWRYGYLWECLNQHFHMLYLKCGQEICFSKEIHCLSLLSVGILFLVNSQEYVCVSFKEHSLSALVNLFFGVCCFVAVVIFDVWNCKSKLRSLIFEVSFTTDQIKTKTREDVASVI